MGINLFHPAAPRLTREERVAVCAERREAREAARVERREARETARASRDIVDSAAPRSAKAPSDVRFARAEAVDRELPASLKTPPKPEVAQKLKHQGLPVDEKDLGKLRASQVAKAPLPLSKDNIAAAISDAQTRRDAFVSRVAELDKVITRCDAAEPKLKAGHELDGKVTTKEAFAERLSDTRQFARVEKQLCEREIVGLSEEIVALESAPIVLEEVAQVEQQSAEITALLSSPLEGETPQEALAAAKARLTEVLGKEVDLSSDSEALLDPSLHERQQELVASTGIKERLSASATEQKNGLHALIETVVRLEIYKRLDQSRERRAVLSKGTRALEVAQAAYAGAAETKLPAEAKKLSLSQAALAAALTEAEGDLSELLAIMARTSRKDGSMRSDVTVDEEIERAVAERLLADTRAEVQAMREQAQLVEGMQKMIVDRDAILQQAIDQSLAGLDLGSKVLLGKSRVESILTELLGAPPTLPNPEAGYAAYADEVMRLVFFGREQQLGAALVARQMLVDIFDVQDLPEASEMTLANTQPMLTQLAKACQLDLNADAFTQLVALSRGEAADPTSPFTDALLAAKTEREFEKVQPLVFELSRHLGDFAMLQSFLLNLPQQTRAMVLAAYDAEHGEDAAAKAICAKFAGIERGAILYYLTRPTQEERAVGIKTASTDHDPQNPPIRDGRVLSPNDYELLVIDTRYSAIAAQYDHWTVDMASYPLEATLMFLGGQRPDDGSLGWLKTAIDTLAVARKEHAAALASGDAKRITASRDALAQSLARTEDLAQAFVSATIHGGTHAIETLESFTKFSTALAVSAAATAVTLATLGVAAPAAAGAVATTWSGFGSAVLLGTAAGTGLGFDLALVEQLTASGIDPRQWSATTVISRTREAFANAFGSALSAGVGQLALARFAATPATGTALARLTSSPLLYLGATQGAAAGITTGVDAASLALIGDREGAQARLDDLLWDVLRGGSSAMLHPLVPKMGAAGDAIGDVGLSAVEDVSWNAFRGRELTEGVFQNAVQGMIFGAPNVLDDAPPTRKTPGSKPTIEMPPSPKAPVELDVKPVQLVEPIAAPGKATVKILSDKEVALGMTDQLQHLTPKAVDDIIARFADADRADARTVLQYATGFGSIESLTPLHAAVVAEKAPVFSLAGSLGESIAYLDDKSIFGIKQLTPQSDMAQRSVVVLDDSTLSLLETDPDFVQYVLSTGSTILYPSGFEGGLNMFRVATPESIAKQATTLLSDARAVQAKKGIDLPSALSEVLDLPSFERLREIDAGLLALVKVVDTAPQADGSNEGIAKRLSSDAGLTTERLTQTLAKLPFTYQDVVRKMFASEADIYSMRRITSVLSEQHDRVMTLAAERGIAHDKVYFYMPVKAKSFGMLALAHKQITGTAPSHYIATPQELAKAGLGSDSMLVVLDDVAGSGDTLERALKGARSTGKYQGDIVLAPMVTTDQAKTLLTKSQEKTPFTFLPHAHKPALRESAFYQSLDPYSRRRLDLAIGSSFGDNFLSMAFPYMAPDNNNELFGTFIAPSFILNNAVTASKSYSFIMAQKK